MSDISFATIVELKKGLAEKKFSRQELLQFFLNRFAQHDQKVKSALEVFSYESLQTSQQNSDGLLDGIPGIIKDNICQKGRIASCASKMLANYRATYDATVMERLASQGAISVGRANLDEFAMGSSTETSAFFKTKNPWNLNCVPGGSSGGSIAAVAAGLVPWALGSETGGSIRYPSAFCGTVGLKPTYGSVSRYGLIAYASSLDQVGPVTRTVYDNALVYSAIVGHDAKDASSVKKSHPKDYAQALDGKLPQGLRIGVMKSAMQSEGLDEQVRMRMDEVVQTFQKAGATIHEIELKALDYGTAAYFIISRAEAASNLSRFDGVRYGYRTEHAKDLQDLYINSRSEAFGKEVCIRMMIGNYVLSAGYADKFYHNAQKVQALIRKDFQDAFGKVDVIIMPTTPTAAFEFGKFDNNKFQMDLQDYFLCGANLAGIPALALPCGFTQEQLPVGFQLIGNHFSEQLLFQVGHAYQQLTDWHTMHPPMFK